MAEKRTGDKVGWLLEKLSLAFGLLFSLVILAQTVLTACRGGAWALCFLLGFFTMGGLTVWGLRALPEGRAWGLALFGLRFLIALGVALLVGGKPVQDFATMYQAACQMAQGSRQYLDNEYFYNWAYQTGFTAYEALVIRLFGEGLLPLRVANALFMGGTGCLVYGVGRRFLPERGALAASLLYALYPAPYFLSGVLTNQHIALFFYALGLWLLARRERLSPLRALGAGLCLSLGNVMRPIGAVVVLALVFWAAVRMLRWKGPGVLREGGLLLAAAVTYYASGEIFSALTRGLGLNPEGLANNLPAWKFVLGLNLESGGAWNQADYDAYYLLPRQEAGPAMEAVVGQRLSSLGVGGFLRLFWKKSQTLWGSLEYLYWGFGHLDGQAPALGGLTLSQCLNALNYWDRGVFFLAFGLGAAALLRWLRRGAGAGLRLPVMLSFLLCGYYAVHLLIEVQARYRYFLMPTIALLAGWGLWQLLRPRGQDAPEASERPSA